MEWEKFSNTTGLDFYADVIEDVNTGYTVLGSKKVKGNSFDFWIVRYTVDGDTIWTKTLGTENNDIPKKIAQLADKSYLLMGTSQIENSPILFLVRIDENGTEQWRKIFADDKSLRIEDIVALEEGGFIVAGGKSTQPETIKLWMAAINASGETVWEKNFRDDINGCFKTIKKLPDGGFALAGQVSEEGKNDCDILTIRTNEKGAEKWSSRIKTPGQKTWPECICCSLDSCFLVVGWRGSCLNDINSENPVFDFDMILSKIDCNGKIVWTKNFDREGSEGGNAVAIRPDGSFIIAGTKMTSFSGKVGPWILHLTADGDELNEKLIRFRFNNDQVTKVINCSDGGFVVIGPGIQEATNTRSDGWIMKFAEL